MKKCRFASAAQNPAKGYKWPPDRILSTAGLNSANVEKPQFHSSAVSIE